MPVDPFSEVCVNLVVNPGDPTGSMLNEMITKENELRAHLDKI